MDEDGVRYTMPLFPEPILNKILGKIKTADAEAARVGSRTREGAILQNERIIKELEEYYPDSGFIAYIAETQGGIDDSDIPPLESMLASCGPKDTYYLIIDSPGGDGIIAEKIVEMFWEYSNHFKVIVPNRAKSAATLIALGAEEIVMGYCSELGPIDPQYPMRIGDVLQWVSANDVIMASEALVETANKAQKENQPFIAYLEQLHVSTVDPVFVTRCRRDLAFTIDYAKTWLPKKMLGLTMPNSNTGEREKKAESIAENLLSVQKRFQHGRFVGRKECKDIIGLNVRFIEKEDACWVLVWELYLRAKVYMMIGRGEDSGPVKIFITRNSSLLASSG